VPYTYVPRNEALEGAGLGLAQAAARLLQMGQAEDAARLAALSTQLLPNDPRSWVLLAEAELRSKNSKQAAVALARAKQLDPNDPRNAELLVLLRQSERSQLHWIGPTQCQRWELSCLSSGTGCIFYPMPVNPKSVLMVTPSAAVFYHPYRSPAACGRVVDLNGLIH
jgi:tetratricopeptide (TPR) repeat protein